MNVLNQRLAILIDEVNIFQTTRRLHGEARVDYRTVLHEFSRYDIVRAISYSIETPENKYAPFRRNAEKLGIEVKSKPIRNFRNGQRKGDWDIGLAMDAIRLSSRVDVILLLTGDGDFEDLVTYLKHQGLKVNLMAFRQQVSQKLLECVDEFIPITNNMLIKKSNR